MIVGLLLQLSALAACPTVTTAEAADLEGPVIVVLGERHGERHESERAEQMVGLLAARGPTTLALEAIHEDVQSAADAFAVHGKKRRLKRDLDWKHSWGYPFRAYWPLLRWGREGIPLVGAGLELGPAPSGRAIAIPDGYEEQLAEAVAGHEMPPDVQARFTRSMAWRDLRIAELALAGWDGKGSLVIVTGRGHVEGARGVTWQLRRLTDAPVLGFLLDAEDATCPSGTPALVDGGP